jgi:hypothetical protein
MYSLGIQSALQKKSYVLEVPAPHVASMFISQRSMSNGFIYVVDAHFIDKIEENKYPGPKCL